MHPERRKVARYMIKLDFDIILDNGTILAIQAYDISLNGLQFKCDSSIANEIEPRGLQSHAHDNITVKVVSRFPTSKKEKFYAKCLLIAARRLSQNEYLINLEFKDFEKNGGKILQDYIKQLALEALG